MFDDYLCSVTCEEYYSQMFDFSSELWYNNYVIKAPPYSNSFLDKHVLLIHILIYLGLVFAPVV